MDLGFDGFVRADSQLVIELLPTLQRLREGNECPAQVQPVAVPCRINDRWELLLPDHRAMRDSWAWHEAARLSAMRHFIRSGDVVYDVGAEEGDHPALWSSWGCDVVLIEPNPKVWPCIKFTFESNGLGSHVLDWFTGLLSDTSSVDWQHHAGAAGVGYPCEWPEHADAPMFPAHGFHHIGEHDDPTTTLDVLVDGVGVPPSVLTIDVEGGELFVLRGAVQVLHEHRPLIFLSIHPEIMRDLYGHDQAQIHELLAGHGYDGQFLAIDHEHHWMFTPR